MAKRGSVKNFISEVYRLQTRERIWVSENAWTITDDSGNVLFYEGVVEDITDRVRDQVDLARTSIAAETVSESKAILLAVMSQELRLPLQEIMASADIIASRLYGPDDARYASSAAAIKAAGVQMLARIEDILDVSRNGPAHGHPCENRYDNSPLASMLSQQSLI